MIVRTPYLEIEQVAYRIGKTVEYVDKLGKQGKLTFIRCDYYTSRYVLVEKRGFDLFLAGLEDTYEKEAED